MTVSHTALLQHLPLAFHDRRAVIETCIDSLAARLSRSLPLAELQAAEDAAAFVHRSAHVRVGDLAVTVAAHSPLIGRCHDNPRAVFTMALYGEKQFRLDGRTCLCRAGHSSLFLPGEGYSVESGLCSGVMFSVEPAKLQGVAAAMVGAPEGASVLEPSRLQAPRNFGETTPLEGRLLGLLRRSLRLIDRCCAQGQACQVDGLRLDDVIHRTLVLLLQPELHQRSWATPTGESPSDGLERLVVAVRHNPCHPWGLSDMERLSGLGSEALHTAVRAAFGCVPQVWLAAERVAWARRQCLESPEPG